MRRLIKCLALALGVLAQILPSGAVLAYNGYGTTYVASVDAQNILNNDSVSTAELSRDGSRAAYTTISDRHIANVYVKDLSTGALRLASTRSDGSIDPVQFQNYFAGGISDDGNQVAFVSNYLDLNHPNVGTDIFVHDVNANTPESQNP